MILPEPETYTDKKRAQAMTAALRILAYRPRSVNEIRLRLEKRFPHQAVQEVLERLQEISLLDDRAFAEFWRDNRERHRPRSASLIRRELRSFGITGELAEDAVRSVNDEKAAYRASKRFAFSARDSDFNIFRRKIAGRLYRRGFSSDIIHTTILHLWEGLKE
jgi:regulatory protein